MLSVAWKMYSIDTWHICNEVSSDLIVLNC